MALKRCYRRESSASVQSLSNLCKTIFPSSYEQLCAGDLGTNAEHLVNLVEIISLAHKRGAISD